jgi:hypothetical protein
MNIIEIIGGVLRDMGDVLTSHELGKASQEQLEAARKDLLAVYYQLKEQEVAR